MRKMRKYRDFLVEELADRDKALSFLEVALEEYEKEPDGAALYYGFSAAVEAQGGVQEFALKTHSSPQAVSDALLSKDETRIAELLKKQVLAKRVTDEDIARNGLVPEGWRKIQLGEFMEFKNGLNTKKENYGRGIKFVNVMDIFSHNYLYANDVIGSVQANEKQRVDYSVRYGDILFNRTSETFEEIAMSSVYLDKKKIIFGGFVIRGRQKFNFLTPEYSAYCFQDHTFRRELIRRGQGAVRANIGQRDLSKASVIIPPVEEQKAIAVLLETWDAAIEKTEALIAAKEKQFKWLLKRLISDQQDNPEWEKTKLGEIGNIRKGKQLNKLHMIKNGKYPVLNGGIGPSGNTDKWNTLANTVTISEGGNSCGYVNLMARNFWAGGHCYTLTDLANGTDIGFLYYLLKGLEQSIMRLRVGSGLPNIQKSDIEKLALTFPSFSEQTKIAQTLNTVNCEINLLEQLAEQYRTQKRGLMQKLLTGKWRVQMDTTK